MYEELALYLCLEYFIKIKKYELQFVVHTFIFYSIKSSISSFSFM